MNVPVEITYREVIKSEAIETVVHRQVAKLQKFCSYMSSCRVAIEKPQQHQRTGGNPFRVRIDITVPPSHELVAVREPPDTPPHARLQSVIIAAFKAARRQLQELVARQRREVKSREEPRGIVVRLEDGWGFLKTDDGQEVYFHSHSVLHGDFDRLTVGTEVRFEPEEGDHGPQASSVQVVSKLGARAGTDEEPEPEQSQPPLGWK